MVALACISAVLFAGCKKDNTCSLTQQSIVGTYRLTGLTYTASPGGTVQDVYNTDLQACERDNVYIFNADGSFYYQDAGTSCNPPDNYSSSWNLYGSTLEFGGDVSSVEYFDCSNMTVTTSNYQISGDVLRATYVKQ
jgi:hypothetical protein